MKFESINVPYGDPERTSITSPNMPSPGKPVKATPPTKAAGPIEIDTESLSSSSKVTRKEGESAKGAQIEHSVEKEEKTEPVTQEKPREPREPRKNNTKITEKPPVEERREQRELSNEMKLKAAEVLGLVDLESDSKERYPEILKRLEREYGKNVIEKAARVAEIRDKGLDVYARVVRAQKTFGREKSLSQIAQEYQQAGKGDYDLFERSNFYDPAIIDLETELLKEKEAYLRKEIERDPILSKLSREEQNEDINKKLLEYKAAYLVRLVTTEKSRDQKLRTEIHAAEKARSAGILRKTYMAYARLPLGLRSVIGAVVLGSGAAAFSSSLVIACIPTYLAYRVGRAVFGGTLAGGLQKLFGNKLVNSVYEKGVKKSFETTTKELKGEIETKKEGKTKKWLKEKIFDEKYLQEKEAEQQREENEKRLMANELKELIAARKFEEVARLNLKIAETQLKRLNQLAKKRKWHTIGVVTATGLIGGFAGAQLFDYLVGPHIAGAVLESQTGTKPSAINPETSKTDGVAPLPEAVPVKPSVAELAPSKEQLDLATVREGEGVTHALARQLKMDPEKFGYNPKGGVDLDRWAMLKSRDIAIENGYIKPDGTEIRVYNLGPNRNPAYLLDQDVSGKFRVHEYFEGKPMAEGGAVNAYEYEWQKPKTEFSEEALRTREAQPLESALPRSPSHETATFAEFSQTPTVESLARDLHKDLQYAQDARAEFSHYTLDRQETFVNEYNRIVGDEMKQFLKLGGANYDYDVIADINKNWAEITNIYQKTVDKFFSLIEKAGLNKNDYADLIVNKKVDVKTLLSLTDAQIKPELKGFRDLVAGFKPQEYELEKTVDQFLKSKITL